MCIYGMYHNSVSSYGYAANNTYLSFELISLSIALIPELIYFTGMASSALQDNFQPYKS